MDIVLLFPGQGSQKPGMGKDLADAFPEARAVFEQADQTLGTRLSRLCFDGPAEELTLTTAELSYLQDRRQAYENLAKRTNLEGVKSVCMALQQAERYGIEEGDTPAFPGMHPAAATVTGGTLVALNAVMGLLNGELSASTTPLLPPCAGWRRRAGRGSRCSSKPPRSRSPFPRRSGPRRGWQGQPR